ncbi:PEP-CTERM sorting domain-containing protein [Paludibaculum fermentans]|uniref:PEP-CTERM sorting domain-containing protein n=1 Tax=Paludibaculum fermentans TaxID=1473598 RepID=A0A7S7SMZ9_PALFE|nr:PEP-CTERM sorting domain-containing protein [Paludibaculum fermentans]QOY90021.1 PEP-CTERM sorting domain-containing protein [Paludibaculum fermentans]
MKFSLARLCSQHLLLAVCLLLVVAAVPSHAATVVLYPFSANFSASVVGSGVTENLDTSHILSGTSVGNDGFGVVLEAYPNSGSTSAGLALINNSFFAVTLGLTPVTLGQLHVAYEVGKGGSSDPRGYFVRSSLDGYTSDLINQVLPGGSAAAPALQSFDLDASAENAITFRFYLYTPNPGGNSVDFRNLLVTTSSTLPSGNPVPEPTTWALSGLGLAAVAAWRRRRA